MAFDFGAVEDLTWIRAQLSARFGCPVPTVKRTPIDQLVKSLISGRTRDEISLRAHQHLIEKFSGWSCVAAAAPEDIERVIRDVTFADVKARHLRDALSHIAKSRPDFDLGFLGRLTVPSALNWLERLPGVGRKVAASTLNFSTLNMPSFVIDTHVLRILQRFGFVRSNADTPIAYDRVMEMADGWSAANLMEIHISMKHLGQRICCAHRAYCSRCPISRRCQASSHGLIGIGVK